MKKLLLILTVIYCSNAMAQQVVAAAGSTFSNANGSLSYTLGEGVAQTLSVGSITLTEGFHQTTISISVVNEMTDLGFTISAFPNPTSDFLKLKVDRVNLAGLQYLFYDVNGKLLSQKNVESNETNLAVQQLTTGIYFLVVRDGTKEVKSFKIIKQ